MSDPTISQICKDGYKAANQLAQPMHIPVISTSTSSSALCVTLVATVVIGAMACAGACSGGAMGGVWLAVAGAGLLGGGAWAMNCAKQGDKAMALKVLAGTIAVFAVFAILGSCTVAGAIPAKTAGWLVAGTTIAFIPSAYCASSSFAASAMTGSSTRYD